MIVTEESAISERLAQLKLAAGHQRGRGTAGDLWYWVVTIPEAPYTIPSVLEPTGVLEERQSAVVQILFKTCPKLVQKDDQEDGSLQKKSDVKKILCAISLLVEIVGDS